MEEHPIPTHHLPGRVHIYTQVEHILPAGSAVTNGVHRHDFHELFFLSLGSGRHMIDLETHVVRAPCVHLVAPGQVHQLDRSADMEGRVVMFASEAQLGPGHAARVELFTRAQRRCTFPLDAAQLAEALTLVQLMEGELSAANGPVAEVVEGYLGILLIKCASWSREAGAADHPPMEVNDPVRRFQELVERDFLEQRQVGRYAEALAMTADHLNELVKDRLGITASSVIHERLLLEARRLLLHADLSIKEVGYALNLKDPAYFTRWFGKAAGMAPAAYREHIRDKYKR